MRRGPDTRCVCFAGCWRCRAGGAPARRLQAEQRLTQAIQAAYWRGRGTYGSPRIHAELKAQGLRVSRKRVARLMRDCGLRGVRRVHRRVLQPPPPSLLLALLNTCLL
jgi:transposase InsO family protein